jgi:xanthine dehydrogenase molybdopterin-binding subunit B
LCGFQSSQDIPLIFNVSLLANATNPAPGSILGSKATAEPPMMLSGSVFFAVKDCIAAYRADQKLTAWFDLAAPASTQAVQLACGITPASLVL